VFKYIIYDIVNVPSHLLYRIYCSMDIIKPVQFVIINIIIYICFFCYVGIGNSRMEEGERMDQKTRTCPQNRKSLGNEILGGFIKQGQVLVFWSLHISITC
jgi:hypothetical protein